MILKYGTYAHADNECEVIRDCSRSFNARGQTMEVLHTWTINGQLHGDTAAEIITAKRALENAYAYQFRDLVLYLSNGTTIQGALRNAGSVRGVRVIRGPAYPTGKGAEGGTYLSYTIVVEAAYEWFQPANNSGGEGDGGSGDAHDNADPTRLESWTETIRVQGGGPRYRMVEVVDGPPVRQLLNGTTTTRITQTGTAVGRRGYPTAPGPIEPNWEDESQRSVEQTSPSGQGSGFQISWTYIMEGPGLGGGAPNPWPI